MAIGGTQTGAPFFFPRLIHIPHGAEFDAGGRPRLAGTIISTASAMRASTPASKAGRSNRKESP